MAATPFSQRRTAPVRAHWLATAPERDGDLWRWRYDLACVAATEAALVPDRWAEIRVAAPVLLFRGAESDIIGPVEIDRACRHLPGAVRADLSRANHRLSKESPKGFVTPVDGFPGS